MESFDLLSKLLDGNIVLGKKEEINESLYIIPVYKVKVSFFGMSTDLKSKTGDGECGSLNVTPVCLLEISNNIVKTISLDNCSKKDVIGDVIPDMLANIDISQLIKGFKFS